MTDDPALWIGAYGHAVETLDDLHQAAIALGYDFMPLPPDVAARLIADKADSADRRPRERSLEQLLKRLNPSD